MKKFKKSLILSALLASFLMASCDGGNSSSSSESSSSSQISSSEETRKEFNLDPSNPQSLTVSELVTTLKTLATNGNFDVIYNKKGYGGYTDTLNVKDGYYYTEYPTYGYGYFPKYAGRDDALFSFTYEDGTLADLNREVYTDTDGVTQDTQPTLQDLNIFHLFDSEDYDYLKEENFVQESSTSVSISDSLFAIYMSVLINFSDTSSSSSNVLSKVVFQKGADGKLYFKILAGKNQILLNSKYYKGAIYNIGTAKNEEVHKVMQEYEFPSQSITESAKTILDSTKMEMDYTIYQSIAYHDGKTETTELAKTKNRYDYSKAFYCTYSSSTLTDYEVYYRNVNPRTHTLYTKAIDAKSGDIMDYTVQTVGDYTYDTLTLYTPAGCLETNAFFGSNNVLNYYGGNTSMTLYFLTSCALIYIPYSPYVSLSAELNDDGSLKDLIGTASGLTSTDGDVYTFTIIFTFKELANDAFPEPEGKKDTADTLAFKSKFIDGKLDGTANVKIETGSDKQGYREEYIEADGTLFIHTFGYDGDDVKGFTRNESYDTYTGYKYDETNNGLIPFTLTKNDDGTFSVKSTGYLKEGTLKDNFAPFAFASALVENGTKDNQYRINLAPLSNLKNALLFDTNMQTFNDSESMYNGYLDLTTDGNHITSAEYTGHYIFSTEESPATITTKYTYTYDVTQDSNVVSAIKDIEAKENPTTWKDESEVWSSLLSYLGQSDAENLPYIYRSDLAGEWRWIDTFYGYDLGFARVYIYGGTDVPVKSFYTDFAAKLEESGSGWTRLADKTQQAGTAVITIQSYQSASGTRIEFSQDYTSIFFDIYKAS